MVEVNAKKQDVASEMQSTLRACLEVESLPTPGDYLVYMPLCYGDGDHIGVYACHGPEGWTLSDDGELWWRVESHGRTCIKRTKRFASILHLYGMEFDGSEFSLKLADRSPADVAEITFSFSQALLAIEALQ